MRASEVPEQQRRLLAQQGFEPSNCSNCGWLTKKPLGQQDGWCHACVTHGRASGDVFPCEGCGALLRKVPGRSGTRCLRCQAPSASLAPASYKLDVGGRTLEFANQEERDAWQRDFERVAELQFMPAEITLEGMRDYTEAAKAGDYVRLYEIVKASERKMDADIAEGFRRGYDQRLLGGGHARKAAKRKKRKNPDERMRELERRAALGDQEALAQLRAMQQRSGANYKPRKPRETLLVEYDSDSIGNMTIRPVSREWQEWIAKQLQERGDVPTPDEDDHSVWAESCRDGSVFIQTDYEQEEELAALTAAQRRDYANGWGVRVRMPIDQFLQRHGLDEYPRPKRLNPWVVDSMGFPEFQRAFVDLRHADGGYYQRVQLDEGELAAIGDEDPLPQTLAEVEQNLRNLLQLHLNAGLVIPWEGDTAHFTIGDRSWVEPL